MSEEPGREEETASAEPAQENASQPEPQTLEEAMSAIRADNADTAPADVEDKQEDGGASEESIRSEPVGGGGNDEDMPTGEADVPASDVNVNRGGSGRSAASNTQVNYQAVISQLTNAASASAVDDINQRFAEHEIKKFSVGDLYQRDENRGRAQFINPDDPDHPFNDRLEAQQWVDSFNAQIDEEFRRQSAERQQEYEQAITPVVRLMEFAPTFDQLSPSVQATMDSLIEPYSVYDQQGRVVGYNCDLAAAARQAMTIDAAYSRSAHKAAVQSQELKPATGPATDMKTRSSERGKRASSDPKDLNDALKMYNESKKKSKKK